MLRGCALCTSYRRLFTFWATIHVIFAIFCANPTFANNITQVWLQKRGERKKNWKKKYRNGNGILWKMMIKHNQVRTRTFYALSYISIHKLCDFRAQATLLSFFFVGSHDLKSPLLSHRFNYAEFIRMRVSARFYTKIRNKFKMNAFQSVLLLF